MRQIFETHRKKIAEAIDAEKRWLDGVDAEPAWPTIAPWHSRQRRTFGSAGTSSRKSRKQRVAITPEMYVDEHALGILAGYLVPLTIGDVPEWLISLAGHFMGWTIEANNGPPGDDRERAGKSSFLLEYRLFRFPGCPVRRASVRPRSHPVYRA